MSGPMSNQMGSPPGPRQGMSKAVPVVMSAGLAVGVFCGLLFGLGTGDEVEAAASTSKDQVVATKAAGDPTATPPSVVPPATEAPTPAPAAGSGSAGSGAGAGSAAVAAAGSGSEPTIAGAGSGSSAPAVLAHKLTIEVKPEAAAEVAKITVDGTEVTGGAFEVAMGETTSKRVKVVVKASGYRDAEKKLEVDGDTTLTFELVKRSRGGGLKRPPPPGGSGKKGGKQGGGLIDI